MNSDVTLTFLGDISLNDRYRVHACNGVNPFTEIMHFLRNSDLVIGNLEAMCDGEITQYPFPKTRLQTDLLTLEYLKFLNMGLVTLANNHVYDNLEIGYKKTTAFLQTNEILYIGTKELGSGQTFHRIVEIKGVKIAFLNYVHPSTNPKIPKNSEFIVSVYEKGVIIEDIIEVRRSTDVVFLILHWGMEDSFYPEPWQIDDAKAFHASGADVIIGHHSHTLQGYQSSNQKYVFYSLGNFCFSPLSSDLKLYEIDKIRHCESIILNVILKKDRTISINWIPIYNEDDFVKLGGLTTSLKFERRSRRIWFIRYIYWFYKFYLLTIQKIISYLFMNNRDPIKQLKTISLTKILRFFKQQKFLFKHG